MDRRIDVDLEFASCVRRMGGVVLDDVLVQPNFPNSDFWFPKSKVFVELKRLSKDLMSDKVFNQIVSNLHASWLKRGLIPAPTTTPTRINLQELPLKCAREFLDPVKRKLETSTVRHANRQIRETKKHFDASDAKGLLLIANDGNYMFPPSMMMHVLSRILKTQHSNINSVVYFSVNEVTSVPAIDTPSRFWIDAVIPNRDPIASDFRRALQEAWMRHFSGLSQGQVVEFQGNNGPDFLDRLQFLGRTE